MKLEGSVAHSAAAGQLHAAVPKLEGGIARSAAVTAAQAAAPKLEGAVKESGAALAVPAAVPKPEGDLEPSGAVGDYIPSAVTLQGCLHRFVRPESLGSLDCWECHRRVSLAYACPTCERIKLRIGGQAEHYR